MKYKNISQRANRYAQSKMRHTRAYAFPVTVQTVAAAGFADGYRFAMKEIRGILDTEFGYPQTVRLITELVSDTERLK